MLYLLLVPVFLYLLILVLLFALQTRMVFPAAAAGGALSLPPGAERLTLATPDGETLHGSLIPGNAPRNEAPRPVVLGFGGNAWNADSAALTIHGLYPTADVLTFHYRGYAPSTGAPGASALTADALLIHDDTARRFPGRRMETLNLAWHSRIVAFDSGPIENGVEAQLSYP